MPTLSSRSSLIPRRSSRSVRYRPVGYAWDRFLGYVKGGGAWERDEYTFSGMFLACLSVDEAKP